MSEILLFRSRPYRWCSVFLSCALVTLAVVLPSPVTAAANSTTEAAKSDLAQVKEKIQQLANALKASQLAKQDANEALKASETAISASRKKLREIQAAQQDNRGKLQDLQKQMSLLQRQVNQQQQSLSQQLNQQYRHGNHSPLQMLLQQQDPASTSRNLKYLGYLTAAHQQQIQSLQDNRDAIERVRTATTEQLHETDRLANQYSDTTHQLENEKSKRTEALTQLSRQIETQEQQLARLKKDEEALSKLFQRLVAEAKKREQEAIAKAKREKAAAAKKAAELARKKKSAGRTFEHAPQTKVEEDDTSSQGSTVVAKNETLPEYNANKENFAQLRGRLRLPVRGEVINRFGSARAETGVSWKGLFIRASEGSEVKSVAGGQVVFADWMRGFGNLIVIDHGNGYMSLYGNNEALYKSSGQAVKAGDTIAAVGNSGGNAENGVYYELRRNSIPFDPLQWSTVK
ncbi:Septal ring factor EnvC, activator of murein hydrolases AmiA and AmiB [Methylophilus rhizosphaerae]|uniref:Septal ring factor EnvC, activator of murein hydrolases AmiA and AmiB n=1 Tax=Methylophilus rhizosphaerae TaxID=492660 RepID=A0A1G9EUW0_9PROT|nr:peptidoglycan DD-metalloendopeptidase family protein [Methylophilus rhizosphaerae]SDK79910.1 Septal ring factor EnvC, activator of murein hydrolases AmiA and AmiB [Methylophilus rhizosphaerae]